MNSAAPDSPECLALARRTAAAWGLQVTDAALVSHSENFVYRVETADGERAALRLHRPGYHTFSELRSEQQWTSALNTAGVHVPIGRPLPNGDYYTAVTLPSGEQRYAGMVDWLDGVLLADLLTATTAPERVARHYGTLGALTARIHNQAAAWQPPDGFTRHHLDADGLMGEAPFWGPFWVLPEFTAGQRDLIGRARLKMYDLLSSLPRSAERYSMIHADLHANNLMMAGDRITVIDFDDAGFGWHIYEIAVSLFTHLDGAAGHDILDAYVEGYRTQRELPDEVLDLLPYFCLIRAMALLGWIHHRREVDRREQLAWLIGLVGQQAESLL